MSDSHDLVREWLQIEGVGPHGLNPEDGPTLVRGTHQDGTGVYAALYADQDYVQHWLLEIHTYRPVDDTTNTVVVDALYARLTPSGVDTAWFNEPRLFFDRGPDWSADSFRWFADQVEAYYDDQLQRHTEKHPPELIAQLEASNEKVRQNDRDRAATIGVVLPHHGDPTTYSKRRHP